MRFRRLVLPSAVTAMVLGCDTTGPDDLLAPVDPSLAVFEAQVRPVPAVMVQLPPAPRPWDTSGAALVSRIRDGEGRATVAFKDPASTRLAPGRLSPAGTRAAVPVGAIMAGLRLLDHYGVEITHYFSSTGAASVVFRDPEMAADFRYHPLVDYIEPPVTATSLDLGTMSAGDANHEPLNLMSSGQVTPWGVTKVGAPQVWLRGAAGSGAKVLIIDHGYDRGHPDLPVIPTSNCGGVYDGCVEGFMGHGTHVTGIVAARNNSFGVVGAAPGISANDLYVWAACARLNRSCELEDVKRGIDQGVLWGVDVINMSLGGDTMHLGVSNAIEQAYNAGIVLVAAAGNHRDGSCFDCGEPDYWAFPARHWRTIAVSGMNQDDSFAHPGNPVYCSTDDPLFGTVYTSSNYGPFVTVSAPFYANSTVGGGYEVQCGTSMAAPHVTGAVALLRGRAPSITPAQVYERLIATATDRGDPGFDHLFGHGVLNAYRFAGPFAVITGPTSVEAGSNCQWNAGFPGGHGTISYHWYRDGQLVGTSSTYQTHDTGWVGFQLDLVVLDADNVQDMRSLSVSVFDGGPVFNCTG